jgi:hypothetical protein
VCVRRLCAGQLGVCPVHRLHHRVIKLFLVHNRYALRSRHINNITFFFCIFSLLAVVEAAAVEVVEASFDYTCLNVTLRYGKVMLAAQVVIARLP